MAEWRFLILAIWAALADEWKDHRMSKDLDLSRERTPSALRGLIRTRSRRLSSRIKKRDPERYYESLTEIRDLAEAALLQDQHE